MLSVREGYTTMYIVVRFVSDLRTDRLPACMQEEVWRGMPFPNVIRRAVGQPGDVLGNRCECIHQVLRVLESALSGG